MTKKAPPKVLKPTPPKNFTTELQNVQTIAELSQLMERNRQASGNCGHESRESWLKEIHETLERAEQDGFSDEAVRDYLNSISKEIRPLINYPRFAHLMPPTDQDAFVTAARLWDE